MKLCCRAKILLILSFVVAGCGKTSPTPKNILTQYLDNSLHGNMEQAYEMLSESDKNAVPIEQYLSAYKNTENEFANIFTSKITYEIKNISIKDGNANADVIETIPDFGNIFSDFMSTAFASAFSGKTSEDMQRMLAKKYKDKDLPMTTREQTFSLVKERDGWRIFLNLAQETKIASLMGEAAALRTEKKLKAAAEKYDEVLRLDSKEIKAKSAKENIEKEIASLEKKQAYVDKIKLYDFTAKYFSTYLDNRVPGVNFKIKNDGDETLNRVKVTVYFKDSSNKTIAEEDYAPVLVNEFSLGDNKPLKPNYIWQMESGKFYTAKSVPNEWQEGNATIKVTDFEFSE